MLRIVLDTNIWVSTILKPHGHYAKIVKKIAQYAEIFIVEEVLAEVRQASLRPDKRKKYKLTKTSVDQAIAAIRGFVKIVTDLPTLEVIREDPDDNIILACAVKAQADYLISYDPHLTDLGEYQGIKILTPKEFLSLEEKR